MKSPAKILEKLMNSGVRVPHHKDTENYPTEQLPIPPVIIMPMSQHIGAPCVPTVRKGDEVFVGQKIGDTEANVFAPIYSSVSGKVTSIEYIMYKSGKAEQVIVIAPDGKQTPDPSIVPPAVHDRASFIQSLHGSGIVGLGGAGFPTDIKVNPHHPEKVETLLINGAECEPYLTTDNREFLECPDSILKGIKACLDYLGIKRAVICIEDNKPAAIDLMTRKSADDDRISVCVLESRYPQGADKILIRNATGITVGRGVHATDLGVMVLNVTTVSSIGKFLQTGMPLVTKRLTVAGDAIASPKNLSVPIGTRFVDILNFCGTKEEPRKIIVGGPMMGNAQMDVNYPVTRQNNGLLVFGAEASKPPHPTECMRCGRCINSCPVGLSPVEIRNAYIKYDADRIRQLDADLCIGCGTCSYVCPAKRPLTPTVTLAKNFMKSSGRGKK